MLRNIQEYFQADRVFYSRHARDEMKTEEFSEIRDEEVFEAISTGKIIENYSEDEPYPSCLIFGRTLKGRSLHVVCAYSDDEKLSIIVTAYQPDPERWTDFSRRVK